MGSAASRTPIAPKPQKPKAATKGKKSDEYAGEDPIFPFPNCNGSATYVEEEEDTVPSLRASRGSNAAGGPSDYLGSPSSRLEARLSGAAIEIPAEFERLESFRGLRPSMPRTWKKGESIGSGSFGTVFLGLNNQTGEAVASHIRRILYMLGLYNHGIALELVAGRPLPQAPSAGL